MKTQPVNAYPTGRPERLASFLFLALIPIVTLVPVTPVPAWLTQDLALRWISALFLAACVYRSFPRDGGKTVLDLDFPDILFLLLSAWVLLSAHNSQEAFDSFYAYRSFLAIVLWWFSLRMFWNRWPGAYPVFEKVFFGTAVTAAVWLAVTTIAHRAGVAFFVERIIPRTGPFPNENFAAGFLGMALIWGALKMARQEKVPLLGYGIVLVAWGLTQSRGALVSMVAVAVFYLLVHMKQIESRLAKWSFTTWLGFTGTFLFVLVCLSWMIRRLFNALDSDPRAYLRFDVWTSGLKMVHTQPLMGFGPGTFQDVYPAFRPGSLWPTLTPFAHNEYLQVAAESGLPALALVLLLIWALLRKTGIKALTTPPFKALLTGARVSECAFYLILFEVVHNFVDFTLHEWSIRLTLMGFVTYALREKSGGGDVRASIKLSGRAAATTLAIFSLFIIWTLGIGGFRDYRAKMDDFQGLRLQQFGQLDEAEKPVLRALWYRPNFMDPWNSLGAIENGRAEASLDPDEREKHFLQAEDHFRKAIQLSPFSPTPRENEIQVMLKRGRFEQALDLEQQLIERVPEVPAYYVEQGQILLVMRRAKDAIAPAQKAIDLDRYFMPAYLLKAEVMERLGKKDDALGVYEQALALLKSAGITDMDGTFAGKIARLKGKK